MGQTLSEPITAKETASLQNSQVKVGSSSMQGWRVSMEDAHTHILKLPDDPEAMFFGVYDGHGGGKIAAHVSKNLHKYILKQKEYGEGNYRDAIVNGFLQCDEDMRHEDSLKDEMSGSTAITVLVRENVLYVNNVGDSRCVCSVNGEAHALSTDHKPADEAERTRIERAGGFVEFNRVNGNLALSRALGDFAFKNNEGFKAEDQIVSGCPEVVVKRIEDESFDFMILACDGIWDVLTNQEAVDFVTRRIGLGSEPEDICEELMTKCLAKDPSMGGLGCDNMTVILVAFLHGKPYQRLVSKCADLVKQRDADRKLNRDHSVDSSSDTTKEDGDHNDSNASEAEDRETESEASKKSKLDEEGAAASSSPDASPTQST